MNTPLILMTAVAVVVPFGWLRAIDAKARWRERCRNSTAAHEKLLTTHLNTLSKLWELQEAEQRRKQQRLAALDKANAANRAARMWKKLNAAQRERTPISEGVGATIQERWLLSAAESKVDWS